MVHNYDYRIRCIEKCTDPNRLAELLRKWDLYYVHDIEHIKTALANMSNQPESENLIHALFEKLIAYPQVEMETLGMLKHYAKYLHNHLQFKPRESPFYMRVTAPMIAACWLADPSPDHELCEELIIRRFVDVMMDLRIPSDVAGIRGRIARNFSTVIGHTPLVEVCNPEEDYDMYRDIEQFRHVIHTLKGQGDDQLLQLLKDMYLNYEEFGRSNNGLDNAIAKVSPFFDAENYDFIDAIYDAYYGIRWYFDQGFSSDAQRQRNLDIASDTICRAVYKLRGLYLNDKSPKNFDTYARLILTDLYEHACTYAALDSRETMREGDLLFPRFQNMIDGTVDYRTTRPNPFFTEDEPPDDAIATEDYDRGSANLQSAQAKIYHAYKNYKNAEQKVDSQLTKMASAAKRLAIGDTRTEIIEGKRFSAIGILKKALATAAVFAFGPIQGIIALVVRYALKKSTTQSERKKILLEMQVELDMINEKIEDARGDNNRKAKYSLMRTKAELEAAIGKIRYGLEVDEKSLSGAKNALMRRIGGK